MDVGPINFHDYITGFDLSTFSSRRVLHDIVDDMGESNQRVGPQQREAKRCILTLSQYDHQLFLSHRRSMAVVVRQFVVVVVVAVFALLVVVVVFVWPPDDRR